VALLGVFAVAYPLTAQAATTNPGDVNGDLVVNIQDLQLVIAHFGQTPSSPGWDARADANGDNAVNIQDVNEVVANWGKTYDPPGDNEAPVVDAGEDVRRGYYPPYGYPVVTLSGTATDDGNPNPPGALTVGWELVSAEPYGGKYGPGDVTIAGGDTLTPNVTFTNFGVYTLRLTVSDGEKTSSDDVVVTIVPTA
jgi:hypothetical protein